MPQEEEWRILAEEASQEQDPHKLLEIVDALNRALAKKDRFVKPTEAPTPEFGRM